MEVKEGQPIVFRKGYKDVPVNSEAVDLKADCQQGDILWWKTKSGNLYQFEIKEKDAQQGFWVGELKDERSYSQTPAPRAELWGTLDDKDIGNRMIKGRGVTFNVLPGRGLSRQMPVGVSVSTEISDIGVLRKPPGLISRLIKK